MLYRRKLEWNEVIVITTVVAGVLVLGLLIGTGTISISLPEAWEFLKAAIG